MLMNMMVACLLGTLISLCVAYLYVYRKEWMDRLFPGGKNSQWGTFFSGLVRQSKQKIRSTSTSESEGLERAGASVGASRSSRVRPAWLNELENLKISSENPNSPKLVDAWLKYSDSIYNGGPKELSAITKEWERTKSNPLSLTFFKRVMVQLLELKAPYRNVARQELREVSEFNRLVVSLASLLLLIEDSEKGSRSLSRALIKNQASEKRAFLAIEYWLFLKTGAAKNALLKQLLKENHPVGRRISSLSFEKRVKLCLDSLTTDWARLPDQKTLLASFVKVMDEIATEEVNQTNKAREEAQSKKNKQKPQTTKSLSKRDEYLLRLGLSTSADFKSVRKAYKRLALEKHPDRLMANSPSEMELKRAHADFLKIQEAYHYLEKNMGERKKSA